VIFQAKTELFVNFPEAMQLEAFVHAASLGAHRT
jgi:hypothetical protein